MHFVAVALLLLLAVPRAASTQSIPASLSDSAFWSMVSLMSEPDGYFRSDNFTSNELTFQYVIPTLNRTTQPGGVYMGVGPDQNFTYIVALKPRIAFIVDVRRQNLLLHLMYKALFETSANRVEFAARLFGRSVPAGLSDSSSADRILAAVYALPATNQTYQATYSELRDHLTKRRGFRLSDNDLSTLQYVYGTFTSVGPGITYQGSGGEPTYWDLMVANDGTGALRSYMASEANFGVIKAMHEKNLIVPIVGDFAGPLAIRAVGQFLRERQATVTAFYLSNVEQYLFQYDTWRSFYQNASSLPVDSSSTFIRSVFNNQAGFRSQGGGRSASMLASMLEQLNLFREGRLNSYQAVISTSR